MPGFPVLFPQRGLHKALRVSKDKRGLGSGEKLDVTSQLGAVLPDVQQCCQMLAVLPDVKGSQMCA